MISVAPLPKVWRTSFCSCVVLGFGATHLMADPAELPTLSAFVAICTDLEQSLADRTAEFTSLGFVETPEPAPLWHTANAAQVGLALNGRYTPYSEAGARAQFRMLYQPDQPRPNTLGQDSVVMARTGGDAVVRLYRTERGLTGCDIAIMSGWDGFDVPLRKDWTTPAGTVQSYTTQADNQRVDATVFNDIWTTWFEIENMPEVWIDISSRPPETTG